MLKSKGQKTKKIKTEHDQLCWHFPRLDHGESEGVNDPLLQYFSGDNGWYVAREVIQNSIDARDDAKRPVVVKFEKIILPTKEIPGIKELRERLKVCFERAKKDKNEKAEKHYREAVATATAEKITLLRASDFNTTGLTGKDEDPEGKWHRLVKAIGENKPTGAMGGSYGIGKGAPFVASKLRTVYYSTKNNEGEIIFQGKTRLLSHQWEKEERRGVGFYGIEGYRSVRKKNLIPERFSREEQGTDLDIIGYDAGDDWMKGFAGVVLENFWMAIHCGDLIVAISDGEKNITIDNNNLPSRLNEFSRNEALPFYRTVVNPDRTDEKQLPILGLCSLYIKKDDDFPRKIETMRKPKMKVSKLTFRKTLQDPYAGVFICDDDEGNKLLCNLEPPEHDDWREGLDKEKGKEIITEINKWIRGALQEMALQEGGDPEDIPELDKFLPFDDGSEEQPGKNPNKASGDLHSEEGPLEIGSEKEEAEDEVEDFIRRATGIENRIRGGGTTLAEDDPAGVEGEGKGTGGDIKGDGDLPSIERIDTSSLKFRTIYSGSGKGKTEYCLIIEPSSDQKGAINIVAAGNDSTIYEIPVSYACDWKNQKKKYEVKGSMIGGLLLKKGNTIKIKIAIDSNERYALGIEKYES